MKSPHENCDYESDTKRGITVHKKVHEGSNAKVSCTCQHPNCDTEFEKYQSQVDKGRGVYCSNKCQNNDVVSGKDHPHYDATKHSEEVCDFCGTTFVVYNSDVDNGRGRFHSRRCKAKWQSENLLKEDNPNWGGGGEDYYGPSWYESKLKAQMRAQGRCEHPDCNRTASDRGKALDVHHIVPFRLHDSHEEANNLDNLIVLCRSHHAELEPSVELTEPMEV